MTEKYSYYYYFLFSIKNVVLKFINNFEDARASASLDSRIRYVRKRPQYSPRVARQRPPAPSNPFDNASYAGSQFAAQRRPGSSTLHSFVHTNFPGFSVQHRDCVRCREIAYSESARLDGRRGPPLMACAGAALWGRGQRPPPSILK
jgi:hypothetical protein